MNNAIKRKWLKALRGGQYRQTKDLLANKSGTAFCCLGVLVDIQGCLWRANADGYGNLFPVHPRTGKVIGDTEIQVKAWAARLPYRAQCDLAVMNDSGKSFKEIADYIEEHL